MQMFRYLAIFIICLIVPNCVAKASNKPAKVIHLDETNWRSLLKNEWMVQFHAPWCPACKSLTKVWEDLSTWSEDLGISVAKIDVTEAPALSGRFLVTALPTIFHVIDGQFRQYRGPRDGATLYAFVEEKEWDKLEQVSSWKYPDSIQMSLVAYFFQLSHYIKDVNNIMHDEYGLPMWLAYGIFAFGTVLFGALLGLLFVFIVDYVCPQKTMKRKSFAQVQANENVLAAADDVRGDDLDESSTSDGEKYSGSDSENEDDEDPKKPVAPGSPKKNEVKASPSSSPDVRKRHTRKAD